VVGIPSRTPYLPSFMSFFNLKPHLVVTILQRFNSCTGRFNTAVTSNAKSQAFLHLTQYCIWRTAERLCAGIWHGTATFAHAFTALNKSAVVRAGMSSRNTDASATPWLAVASDLAAAIGCAADDVTGTAGMATVGWAADSIAAATMEAAKRMRVEALCSVMVQGERWKPGGRWQARSASDRKQVN